MVKVMMIEIFIKGFLDKNREEKSKRKSTRKEHEPHNIFIFITVKFITPKRNKEIQAENTAKPNPRKNTKTLRNKKKKEKKSKATGRHNQCLVFIYHVYVDPW